MSEVLKKLSLLTLVLFIVGVFISGYTLFTLPNSLTSSPGINEGDVDLLGGVLNDLNLKIYLTFFVGAISVLLALLHDKKSNRDNIVYVQTGDSGTKSEVVKKNIGIEDEEKESINEALFDEIINKDLDLKEKAGLLLSKLCMEVSASQGAFYLAQSEGKIRKIVLEAAFAFSIADSETVSFEFGEGLAGQVAKEGKKVVIDEVPEGYIKILSGLGESSPAQLYLIPVILSDGTLLGVVEIASFSKIRRIHQELIESVFTKLAVSLEKEPKKRKTVKKTKEQKET
jgi:putative methionine-R-sulfoxide reductase with GAF domain